jgi:hypothetical protein
VDVGEAALHVDGGDADRQLHRRHQGGAATVPEARESDRRGGASGAGHDVEQLIRGLVEVDTKRLAVSNEDANLGPNLAEQGTRDAIYGQGAGAGVHAQGQIVAQGGQPRHCRAARELTATYICWAVKVMVSPRRFTRGVPAA